MAFADLAFSNTSLWPPPPAKAFLRLGLPKLPSWASAIVMKLPIRDIKILGIMRAACKRQSRAIIKERREAIERGEKVGNDALSMMRASSSFTCWIGLTTLQSRRTRPKIRSTACQKTSWLVRSATSWSLGTKRPHTVSAGPSTNWRASPKCRRSSARRSETRLRRTQTSRTTRMRSISFRI